VFKEFVAMAGLGYKIQKYRLYKRRGIILFSLSLFRDQLMRKYTVRYFPALQFWCDTIG
jgi:hypothetical protein